MKPILLLVLSLLALPSVAAPTAPQAMPDSPLSRSRAISRVIAGTKVYACKTLGDWFSDQPGTCPNSSEPLDRVIAIKDGRALLQHGGFAGFHQPPTGDVEGKP